MNAPLAQAAAESALLVTLTVGELRALVHEATLEAIAEHEAERLPPPVLVGPVELGRLLGVSRTTIHRLRQDGMPSIRIGDVFKYEPSVCLAWLRERGATR